MKTIYILVIGLLLIGCWPRPKPPIPPPVPSPDPGPVEPPTPLPDAKCYFS